MSQHTEGPSGGGERAHTAGAFDIRTLIAMLIGIYGVILVIVGIVNHSDADLAKPGGININLWTGIGMLVAAAAFEAWALWRPVEVPSEEELRASQEEDERARNQATGSSPSS